MPGLAKIGKTTQTDVKLRMDSVVHHREGPVPFECVYAVEVDDCARVKSALHIAVRHHRIHGDQSLMSLTPAI